MKPAGTFLANWLLPILALPICTVLHLHADVIYLSDGNILLTDRAWEEGDQVKYQTGKGVRSLPRSSVQEIRKQDPIAPAPGRRWALISPHDRTNLPRTGPEISAPVTPPMTGGTAISTEALSRLRDNLRAEPSDGLAKAELVHALNSAAALQVSQGDLASAQKNLEEALRLEDRNAALLSNLATVYFRLGNYQKAEDLLRVSLQVVSKNQWTYYLLGETYYKQEKISQAIREWNEGLRLGPNEAISQRMEKAQRESGIHSELGAMKSVHFILRYDRKASDYQLGEQILAVLEDQYRHLSNTLTSRAPETIAVILYPDKVYFDITRAPGWTGGIYDGKIRIPIRGLFSITPELKAALVHELTHCFMTALPGRGIPTWFLEGVAQAQEGKSTAGIRRTLAQLQHANRLIPLKNLSGSFMNLPHDAVELAYSQSLSAVEYLVAKFGRSALRELLELVGQNYNFENAFSAALQRSISEFEAAWHRNLASGD
jgi:tetratricopeptide (TPR) repeat protein